MCGLKYLKKGKGKWDPKPNNTKFNGDKQIFCFEGPNLQFLEPTLKFRAQAWLG